MTNLIGKVVKAKRLGWDMDPDDVDDDINVPDLKSWDVEGVYSQREVEADETLGRPAYTQHLVGFKLVDPNTIDAPDQPTPDDSNPPLDAANPPSPESEEVPSETKAFGQIITETEVAGETVVVEWVPTNGIQVNAEELQYKETDGSADGLNEKRRKDEQTGFDPMAVPPLALWRDPDGQIVVVDGHKRLGSARRNGCPVVRAFFITASTFDEAKKKGEQLNKAMGTDQSVETKAFDESKVKRDREGKFAEKREVVGEEQKGSADTTDSASAPDPAIVKEYEKQLDHWLASSNLPEGSEELYKKVMLKVLSDMPNGCRKAAMNALTQYEGKIVFLPDTKAVEKAFGPGGKGTVGFVRHRVGEDWAQMFIDHDGRGGTTDPEYTMNGIYSHEIGHCVDAGRRYSRDAEWVKVWEREVCGKGMKAVDFNPLSKYAKTDATEGFAEFHRAIVQKGVEEVRKRWPKCTAFLEKKGLL